MSSVAVVLSVVFVATPHLIDTGDRIAWLDEQAIAALGEAAHAAGHCGGFMDITAHPYGAMPMVEPFAIEARVPRHGKRVRPTIKRLSTARIEQEVATLSGLHDRFYDGPGGEEATRVIAAAFQARARKTTTVETFGHAFRQASVIARIPGHGPHASEKIVLGAHADSINWEQGRRARAPGADDNASGVAVLLETFRVLEESNFEPDRTIEFMAYAGEEVGLLGSQDIAEAYRAADEKVVGVMQMDMTLFPASTRAISLIADGTSSALTTFAGKLTDTYLDIKWQHARCGYACSDHASWHRAGYPAVFPFESTMEDSNPDIHSARDTLRPLDPSFGLQFAKLATAFAMEMAITE